MNERAKTTVVGLLLATLPWCVGCNGEKKRVEKLLDESAAQSIVKESWMRFQVDANFIVPNGIMPGVCPNFDIKGIRVDQGASGVYATIEIFATGLDAYPSREPHALTFKAIFHMTAEEDGRLTSKFVSVKR
jgi:hypothetical protein